MKPDFHTLDAVRFADAMEPSEMRRRGFAARDELSCLLRGDWLSFHWWRLDMGLPPSPEGRPPGWREALCWLLLLAALAALAAGSAAETPTVYRAWPSGRCAAVFGGGGDCASLPPVHHTVWVSEAWTPER